MPDRIDCIAAILRCAGVLLPNDYTPTWDYEHAIDELAAKIDTELHPRIETPSQLDSLPSCTVIQRDAPRSLPLWKADHFWCLGERLLTDRAEVKSQLPARVLYTPGDDHA
ncbi:hypothetical protein [Mycobacteroides immunogenum]|uniref:Uncharacterized protein n=1 Tax=Mycobacteroides immunogenum TaxID=83262 RepID=A0A7V8LR50_9MYCO|nr:hypothetical protein [Mycobacteroides immunogenum]AMT72065.1 hypothetical protein ABG82_18990 [Mycobacteroides immunogenum]ANO05195.1 hypothetical protein BAB75_19260 [Mycobacteroides immunogenum]KIU40136.1 hypothetical protein TL11_12690 [Mycobacteroides immunogenum]KPG13633.1 hypothetical protein AN909_04965 [Mycobacteroides immunogenum]KPG14446.1 hypothetical protein AN908_07900 [Mycobacteroides immunogenum]